jgi:hypothetical protein
VGIRGGSNRRALRPTVRRNGVRLVGVLALGGSLGSGLAIASAQVASADTDTVVNCSGSASVAGSLPSAVANASAGDTINFSLGGSCSVITLSATITISQSLTIDGPGASALGVSGGGSTEVFDVTAGTVAISGLTIEDGTTPAGSAGTDASPGSNGNGGNGNQGGDGGGISNAGTLTLTDDTVSGNTTGPGGTGGQGDPEDANAYGGQGGQGGDGAGIYNTGTLDLSGDTVSGNTTGAGGEGGTAPEYSGNGGNGGDGAGIWSSGYLSGIESTISGNSAGTGGSGPGETFGGNGGNSGSGAGIFNVGAMLLAEDTVTANAIDAAASGESQADGNLGGSGGNGGGVYNDSPSTVNVAETTISDNSAGDGGDAGGGTGGGTGGNGGSGGGVYSTTTLVLTADTIAADQAGNGVAGPGSEAIGNSSGRGGNGGGVFATGSLQMTNDTITGDEAGSGAGGDAGDGDVGGNGGSGGNGGGIYSDGSPQTLLHLTLVRNGAGSAGTGATGTNSSGTSGTAGAGGNIFGARAVKITATILAESSSGGNCGGTITDGGYNIDDNTSCHFTSKSKSISDSNTLDRHLAASLAQNGGPTETILITSGSPAIGKVTRVDCPATDQRGAPRHVPCAIGAFDPYGDTGIKSFTPTSAKPGATITITGSNLAGVTLVTFHGVDATSIKVKSNSRITVKVPAGATTGKLTVTTKTGGTARSSKSFKVT